MPFEIGGDKDCEHDSLYYIGSDSGGNKFLKCQDCGAVVVVEVGSDSSIEKVERPEEDKNMIDIFLDRFLNR